MFNRANTTYYRLGLDERKVSAVRAYVSSVDSKYDTRRAFEGSSTAASFSLGNQWQWENFTLGCDWIGYTTPLGSKVESQSYASATSPDYERARLEEDKSYYLKESFYHGLRFYLGATF
jgi:hypothetical protein